MSKVIILRRPLEKEDQTTGIGVYSDMIEQELDKAGIKRDRIVVNMSIRYGYIKCFTDGFIRPFLKSLRSKADVFHATDEFCCLYFPFTKGRRIVTFHHMSSGMEGQSAFYLYLWKFVSRIAAKKADVIVAVSEQTKKEIIAEYGLPSEKIVVLTHLPPYDFKNLNLPREKIIGCVSSLIDRKNIAGAIRAFSEFTYLPNTEDFKLVICGTGPLKTSLEKLAEELGIEKRVQFISGLNQEELEYFYNTMCVYANPSKHEGLGLTPLEAQACGTPVVYFADADIPKEVTKHYVKSTDEKDFAKKLHLLAFDQQFREDVVSRFENDMDFKEKYMEKLFDLYFN